jgi:hypothetical protein
MSNNIMKQYTITIPDNKVNVFIEMMKSITFVKKIEEEFIIDIPEEHKSIVRERISKYENCPKSYLEWEDIDNNIVLD